MSGLMQNKKGVVMGVANDHSIAWGIAEALHAQGAEMAFTYQGEAFGKRVTPLAQSLDAKTILDCDVTSPADIDRVFADVHKQMGKIDFVVHAIAYSNKEELKGRFSDTTRDNFLNTMDISCYSWIAVARAASRVMNPGGSMITLSYIGAERVIPNYNVMGVAKAALEAATRYLAADLGPQNLRVNTISAGPMRTLAGSAIGSARKTFKTAEDTAPLRRSLELHEIGNAALYLLSPLSSGVTGECHYVDNGFHAMGMQPHDSGEE
jgi:enoyl-[acyl-carrier protein] reductase I